MIIITTAEPSVARQVNDNDCGGGGGDWILMIHPSSIFSMIHPPPPMKITSEPQGEGAANIDD